MRFFQQEDHQPIITHKIGQIITMADNPTSERYFAPRHYTIVSPPGANYYSFVVKLAHFHHQSHDHQNQDSKAPYDHNLQFNGVMSTFLHSRNVGDVIHLFPPFGTSFFDASEGSSVRNWNRFNHGMLLPQAVQFRSSIAVFHADKQSKSHPFRSEIDQLLKSTDILFLIHIRNLKKSVKQHLIIPMVY